ncbi:unnamed protein product, partial [Prorocentrum cordatum]
AEPRGRTPSAARGTRPLSLDGAGPPPRRAPPGPGARGSSEAPRGARAALRAMPSPRRAARYAVLLAALALRAGAASVSIGGDGLTSQDGGAPTGGEPQAAQAAAAVGAAGLVGRAGAGEDAHDDPVASEDELVLVQESASVDATAEAAVLDTAPVYLLQGALNLEGKTTQ